ncbi:MAG: protein kinase [Proteobacteria bacterium]|nr:protein kinase [Pseudomonadota bacterium]
MNRSQNSDSSTTQTTLSSNFLQDSSLLTHLPEQQQSGDDKLGDHPSGESTPKKELVSVSASGGQMTLDFSIHFKDLTIGKLLGQGGYGKVYAGEWQFNTVAIKQYAAQDFSEQAQNEILKEAKVMATASTQSDYLVRLRGIVLEKPYYSLVMEYMPGGDLFHLLKSSQELTWTMRYRISLDMTIGLHHLHQRNILHRDLKSLNVLLDMNFRAKLADFGLSSLKTSSASTTAGEFKGTLLWSAPELFKRGAKATAASDLYALAMVFWELITRKIPFADAPSPSIAIDWVKSGEQENIPEGTPEQYKTIILDCWNKTSEKRPSAWVVAKRLDMLLQGQHQKPSIQFSSSSSGSSTSSSTIEALFEGKSLVTFSNPSSPPAVISESPPSPKPVDDEKHNQPIPASKNSQIFMPTPITHSTKVSKDQLKVQDALVKACESGDLKAVQALFKPTWFRKIIAKPDIANNKGVHPLGAAVWGMNKEIIEELIKQAAGIAPLTWKECEEHNYKHYKNVFTIQSFEPKDWQQWHDLIKKLDHSPFLQSIHLKELKYAWTHIGQLSDGTKATWKGLKIIINRRIKKDDIIGFTESAWIAFRETNHRYAALKYPISQRILQATNKSAQVTLTGSTPVAGIS